MKTKLNGWDEIVYTIIKEKFKNDSFFLTELYAYGEFFKAFYPNNFSIQNQLRKTLVNLRERGLLEFQFRGVYRLLEEEMQNAPLDTMPYHVFIATNPALPDWVLIGHSKDLKKKAKSLFNNVPLPFVIEDSLKIIGLEKALIVEKLIATVIETINRDAIYDKISQKRNFYRLEKEKVKLIFDLVNKVFSIVKN